MNDLEKERAERLLLEKLQEAEDAVKDSNAWLSMEEIKEAMKM